MQKIKLQDVGVDGRDSDADSDSDISEISGVSLEGWCPDGKHHHLYWRNVGKSTHM